MIRFLQAWPAGRILSRLTGLYSAISQKSAQGRRFTC